MSDELDEISKVTMKFIEGCAYDAPGVIGPTKRMQMRSDLSGIPASYEGPLMDQNWGISRADLSAARTAHHWEQATGTGADGVSSNLPFSRCRDCWQVSYAPEILPCEEMQQRLPAARNLPESGATTQTGISELAGNERGGTEPIGGYRVPLRLNLASGQRPFGDGWTQVDCQEKWNPDVVADIRSMPMFPDGSAELVIIWHGLEHFGCGEANPIIKECHRIIQPGGKLIVATPNIRALAIAYLTGRITEENYLMHLYGAFMGDEADRHKWNFSQAGLLQWISDLAPWRSVKKWDGVRPKGTDICGDFWMATAEARK